MRVIAYWSWGMFVGDWTFGCRALGCARGRTGFGACLLDCWSYS